MNLDNGCCVCDIKQVVELHSHPWCFIYAWYLNCQFRKNSSAISMRKTMSRSLFNCLMINALFAHYCNVANICLLTLQPRHLMPLWSLWILELFVVFKDAKPLIKAEICTRPSDVVFWKTLLSGAFLTFYDCLYDRQESIQVPDQI